MEGKAGNLTDLTLGMLLAEKPPTWLQVMHERLKHLIISSERFKEKKKAKYNAQVRSKQIRRGKGIGKHSKGIRFWGVCRKGKRLSRNNNQMKIISHNTSSKQTSGSAIGVTMSCSVLFDFSACIGFYVLLLFHFL